MKKTVRKQKGGRRKLRREIRTHASLPVGLAGGKGVTRDISASGIFFETESHYQRGNNIDMALEFITPAGRLQFKCQGVIVRVEQHSDKMGVAVKITDSLLRYEDN